MIKYLITAILFFITSANFAADFIAGKDYEILKTTTPVKNQKIIHVTEFFSFGCPWCFRIEPSLNKWVQQQKSTVSFKKVPVVFNKDWQYYAKAYYAAEALGIGNKLNIAIFQAIQEKKLVLNNDQAMIDFFIKEGVTPATAESAFKYSTSIDLSIKNGLALMAKDRISAVPAFVVNNQFKTDLLMAKTEERLFAILNFLMDESQRLSKG